MNKSFILKTVKHSSEYYEECFTLSVISKQLYNVGLYSFRQSLIQSSKFLTDKEIYLLMKSNENWKNLPAKVSNQVWMQVCKSWRAWLSALKIYKVNPSVFTGRPRMPKYKSTTNIVKYENGAIGTKGLSKGSLRLSKTDIILDISKLPNKVKQVYIIPCTVGFKIIAIYNEEKKENNLNEKIIAGIDLGLNNLIALTTNQANIRHLLVNGRHIKSVNLFWNKTIAKLQSLLEVDQHNSSQINNLTVKRNNKINTLLHKISRFIVDYLVENKVGSLVIGNNKQWKTNSNMGKKNNQKFIQIPHKKLIDLLTYKFEQENGKVILTEESYTSKSSSLDLDTLPKFNKTNNVKHSFSGKRVKRGLYKTIKGHLINSDVNGSLNIIRKVFRKSLDDLIGDKQFIHLCKTPKLVTVF